MNTLPDFSLNISHKRPVCALDPMLALSMYGLPLLARLGEVMEVWVARELWHILDNTNFYLEQPESLFAGSEQDGETEKARAIMQILAAWERVRFDNDPARQGFYWFADSPLESFLPETIEPTLLWRYEILNASLDQRLIDKNAPLSLACRDTATLAVCLPNAFVLTCSPLGDEQTEPAICQVLEQSGISCQQMTNSNVWQQQESSLLRQALVKIGISKWVWAGLKLAVLQLVAPAAFSVDTQRMETLRAMDYGLDMDSLTSDIAVDYWREARGFWYLL
jgi:hypothetical protein